MKFCVPRLSAVLAASALAAAHAQDNTRTRLPDVTATGEALGEEQLVGDNQQPEWTTQRRFATTRIYVLSPWQVEFEQWWKGKFLRDHTDNHLFQSEVEIGLPYRFQLDFYENLERTSSGNLRHAGNQVEARYAFADWGKIWLNPTVYGEWKFNDHEPDAFEVKLLLGEEFGPRWHWGANFFYEQEVGGDRQSELGFAQGISYTFIDRILSAGVELNIERASHRNLDGSPETEVLIGPSVQWRPIPRMHLDFVPLFGVTDDSPRVEAFIVFGFDLWKGQSSPEGYVPSSTRGR